MRAALAVLAAAAASVAHLALPHRWSSSRTPGEGRVGAESLIDPAQATIRYSWMSPPRRSVRHSLARSGSPRTG